MHKTIEPAILYFGTPVVLITTLNSDGTVNVAPMSSIWWLGSSCMIGLDGSSKTTENLLRTKQCVLNLASSESVKAVDCLAKTTGQESVPLHKKALGYEYIKDKLDIAGLTKQKSEVVSPPRILECLIQLEATLEKAIPFAVDNPKTMIPTVAFELNVEKVHAEESLLFGENQGYVNPDKWHPLIMSFRKFYTTGDTLHKSRLSEGCEDKYAPWKQSWLKRKVINLAIKNNTKSYAKAINENKCE